MNYRQRRENLNQHDFVKDRILLVTEPKNLRYLCGFNGSAGWLLLIGEEHHILTDGRYWEQVGHQSPEAKLFPYDAKKHGTLAQALVVLLDELALQGTVTLETDAMSLSVFRELETALVGSGRSVDEVEGYVKALRLRKDSDEIDLLQEAASIADRALSVALKNFAPGRSELDLKAELEYQILKAGGEGTSFSTIVASGPNGSLPHAGASSRIVGESELITIDFGAVYRGYCSDMTRTIWYGALNNEDERLIRATRLAQQTAVDAVRAGLSCAELDSVARKILDDAGLGQYFVHSLGHGVGLDIHENPGVRGTNSSLLQVGHVITVEPGVYIPGLSGCRVEDTVVVEESGCRVLNAFPKQPLGSTEPHIP